MNTRAKLVCVSVTPDALDETKKGESVTFDAIYDAANSQEDNTFSKFTPSAGYTMFVSNPELFGVFEVGKPYYFDITPCE